MASEHTTCQIEQMEITTTEPSSEWKKSWKKKIKANHSINDPTPHTSTEDKIQNLVSQLYCEGYESMLVIVKASENIIAKHGSRLGKTFLDKWPDISTDFIKHCTETVRRQKVGTREELQNFDEQDDLEETKVLKLEIFPKQKSEDSDDKTYNDENDKVLIEECVNSIKTLPNESVETCTQINENHLEQQFQNEVEHEDRSAVITKTKVRTRAKSAHLKDETMPKENFTLIDFFKQNVNQSRMLNFPTEKGISNGCSINSDNEEQIKEINGYSKDLVRKLMEKEQRPKDVEGRAKRVVEFYQRFDSLLQQCIDKGNVCLICDNSFELKHLKHHLDLHKKSGETALETCPECGITVPPSYILKHPCKTTRKPIPENVIAVDRDIRDDVALIETKLHWRNFVSGTSCYYCDVVPTCLGHYRKHLMSQHKQKYGCMICNNVIHGYLQILKHMKEHDMGKDLMDQLNNMTDDSMKHETIKCLKCEKVFAHKGSVKRHILKVHLSPRRAIKYECSVCEKQLDSEKKLAHHSKVHRKRLFCDIEGCGESFRNYREVENHKLLQHREIMEKSRPFLCSQCGQGFLRRNTMLNHMEWKHGVGEPQECDICHKMFRGKNVLFSHKKSHSEVLKYMCELCGVSYKQRSGLYHHKTKFHRDPNAEVKKFKCEVCNAEFARKTTFRHHIVAKEHYTSTQIINKKFIYECKKCSKKFGSKDRIDRHTSSVHENVTVSTCKYCGKGFSDKSNLRQHLHIHIGKPSCDICNTSFRSTSKLKEHIQDFHSGADGQKSKLRMEGRDGVNMLQYNQHEHTDEIQISVQNIDGSSASTTRYHLQQPLNLITDIGSHTYTVMPDAMVTETGSVSHRLVTKLEECRVPVNSDIDQSASVQHHQQWSM